eukprot:Anaeramoba_flamelloidesa1056830_33.p1 GENE.a1056830_33~~a1056830_33.p1  ORF type:complete len:256 (+),score=28.92 a1056830_33:79-846(+)
MFNIVKNSEAVIVLGSRISLDSPELKDAIKLSGSDFVYMHPIDDVDLEETYTQFIKYEVGSEEGVLALLASFLIKEPNGKTKTYLDELDIGYLSAESNVGEEELEELVSRFDSKDKKLLILGSDLLNHSRADNIAKLIDMIEIYSGFMVLFIDKEMASKGTDIEDVEELDTYNGCVIYGFESSDNEIIKGAQAFATAAKIKAGDMVNVEFDGFKETKKFQLDSQMKGTVALYPIKDATNFGYRFKQVRISKVDDE